MSQDIPPEFSEEKVKEMIVDLVPEDFDWQEVVRRFPIPAVAVAAAGGFFLGRLHGKTVLDIVSKVAMAQVSTQFADLVGENFGVDLDLEKDLDLDPPS